VRRLGSGAQIGHRGQYLSERDIRLESDLGPYVQNALNGHEYILGSIDTGFGALCASHRYPYLSTVNYVGIGDEDNSNGGERLVFFHELYASAVVTFTQPVRLIPDSGKL